MNILMIGQVQIPFKIGMGARLWEFSKNLVEKGHKVIVLCSLREKNEKKFEIINGIKVHRITEIRKPTRWLASLLGFFMFFKAAQICMREKIDIIHGHVDIGTQVGRWVKKFLRKIKVVYDMHGLALEEFVLSGLCSKNSLKAKLIKQVIAKNACHADNILVVSNCQKTLLRKSSRKKVAVVPNGVNLSVFKPVKTKKLYDAVHLGLLEGWAGADILIRAAKIVAEKRPNFKMIFIGSGPKLFYLKKIVKQEKVENNILFIGQVPQEKVPTFLAKARIGLIMFPKDISTDVACPIKIFEYAAMSLPVVAPSSTNTKKLVQDNKIGLIAKPDAQSFADAILYLLKNTAVSEKMGSAGKKFAKKYQWKNITDDLIKIYEKLLA